MQAYAYFQSYLFRTVAWSKNMIWKQGLFTRAHLVTQWRGRGRRQDEGQRRPSLQGNGNAATYSFGGGYSDGDFPAKIDQCLVCIQNFDTTFPMRWGLQQKPWHEGRATQGLSSHGTMVGHMTCGVAHHEAHLGDRWQPPLPPPKLPPVASAAKGGGGGTSPSKIDKYEK
jgi:hypothetical protein